MNNTEIYTTIRNHYSSSLEKKDISDKFGELWRSLNSFYNEGQEGQKEYIKINLFIYNNKVLYEEIDKNGSIKIFYDKLNIKSRPQINGQGGICNVQKYRQHLNLLPLSKKNAVDKYIIKEFKNINEFSECINCLYIIRCNLIHGDKDPYDINDKAIVELAYNALNTILTHIYKFYGIIE